MSTHAFEALQSAAAISHDAGNGSVTLASAEVAFYRMILGQRRGDGRLDEARSSANKLNLQKEIGTDESHEGTCDVHMIRL